MYYIDTNLPNNLDTHRTFFQDCQVSMKQPKPVSQNRSTGLGPFSSSFHLMKGTKQEQEESTKEDPSLSLFSEEKEDPDKIKMDETEEIRMNGKEKTKDEFHFKETCYKKRLIYETSYLDGNQENSKLEMFKEIKDKERFLFEKPHRA